MILKLIGGIASLLVLIGVACTNGANGTESPDLSTPDATDGTSIFEETPTPDVDTTIVPGETTTPGFDGTPETTTPDVTLTPGATDGGAGGGAPTTPGDTGTPGTTQTPGATTTPGETTTPTISMSIVDEVTWEDKLQLTLWMEEGDDNVTTTDTVNLRASVTNISDQSVEFTMWNTGDPAILFLLDNPDNGAIRIRGSNDPAVDSPSVSIGTLEPGETIRREIEWDLTLTTQGDSIAAPNGDYMIFAEVYPGMQTDATSPERLRAMAEVTVAGSANKVSSKEALAIALDTPSAERWLEAHSSQAVARQSGDQFLVNVSGQWQTATEQEYQQALSSQPDLHLEPWPGYWQVCFIANYGYLPGDLTVEVDMKTGDVIRVVPNLMDGLDGGVVATFSSSGSIFSAFVTNPTAISVLMAVGEQRSDASVPNGKLLEGPGAGLHNLPWAWHLDAEDINMAEPANIPESCDGEPDDPQSDLDRWLNEIGRFCPRNARLVNVQDYR